MKSYNGHRSWNAWNVALWISNDEPLYRFALEQMKRFPILDQAARSMVCHLPDRTPDGARYNVTSVRAALVGLS